MNDAIALRSRLTSKGIWAQENALPSTSAISVANGGEADVTRQAGIGRKRPIGDIGRHLMLQ